MGIEAWYWFHRGKQKQKRHGEFGHIVGLSGIDVLCTNSVLINQKQNKTNKKAPLIQQQCSEITLMIQYVSKLKSLYGVWWGGSLQLIAIGIPDSHGKI